ncbi:MAG: hypothetical protein QOF89_5309 [Acidobacteriota bacterium]|nr:hypothetical protein [Acidobacteriota bacterium]
MEPQSPPPPVAPFNPAPRPVGPQGRSGCSKPLIIGCVSVFLVGAIALLGGLYYVSTHAAALLQWSFQQMETGLMAQLPKDVTPQEKANLQQAFADVRQAVQEKKVGPERLQPIQWKMMEVARKGNSLTRQDILDLTRTLQEAVGKTPANGQTVIPGPAETPAPAGTP